MRNAALLGLACGAVACAGVSSGPADTPGRTFGADASSLAEAPAADPARPGVLAVPGPAAAPCTSDTACLNYRCNVAYGKCAFPCASDADCARGTSCFRAVVSTCQPKPPNE